MARSFLDDGFGHHAWATARLLEACAGLTDAQLASAVPGTYGSILDTLRHLVESDSWYLHRLSDERLPAVDCEQMGLDELRATAERNAAEWPGVLEPLDPDAVIAVRDDDGSEFHAAVGIRVAQVLHHGTDHRSQVCTALTALGNEPPDIDVWSYGEAVGRVTVVEAAREG